MNKTEAIHTNVVLDWLIGAREFDQQVRISLRELAARSNKALSAGTTPAQVDRAFPEGTAATVHAGIPAPVLGLLAACWEHEGSDGGWNGGDTVELLCDWFTGQGINITHPAVRDGNTDGEAREVWDSHDLTEFAAQHATDKYAPTDGDGWPLPDQDNADDEDCPDCDGTGRDLGDRNGIASCPRCEGTGSTDADTIAAAVAARLAEED